MNHSRRFEEWMRRFWIKDRKLDRAAFEAVLSAGRALTAFFLFTIQQRPTKDIDLDSLTYESWSTGNAGGIAYLPGSLLPADIHESKKLASETYGAQSSDWDRSCVTIQCRRGKARDALCESVEEVLVNVHFLRSGLLLYRETNGPDPAAIAVRSDAEHIGLIKEAAKIVELSIQYARGRIFQAIRDTSPRVMSKTDSEQDMRKLVEDVLRDMPDETETIQFREFWDRLEKYRGKSGLRPFTETKTVLDIFLREKIAIAKSRGTPQLDAECN